MTFANTGKLSAARTPAPQPASKQAASKQAPCTRHGSAGSSGSRTGNWTVFVGTLPSEKEWIASNSEPLKIESNLPAIEEEDKES